MLLAMLHATLQSTWAQGANCWAPWGGRPPCFAPMQAAPGHCAPAAAAWPPMLCQAGAMLCQAGLCFGSAGQGGPSCPCLGQQPEWARNLGFGGHGNTVATPIVLWCSWVFAHTLCLRGSPHANCQKNCHTHLF